MRRIKFNIKALPLLFTLLILTALMATSAAGATLSSTIDFEGLAEGAIVSSVSFGNGISGADAGGSVGVSGTNPNFPGQNAAMIFDAECLPSGTPADCSGGDTDLLFPGHGNVLIVSEDLDSNDPDDSDVAGSKLEFDFSTWGPGTVTVESLDIGDVERDETGGFIEVFSGSTSLGTFPLPTTGDNVIQTVAIGVSGVDRLVVLFNGSGAVDNIKISVEEVEPPPPGNQGCTPGFWKNHEAAWGPTGYSPGQTVGSVFTVPADLSDLADDTLLEALDYGGGPKVKGAAQILLRAAVAALLNASHPDVDYPSSPSDVIADVNSALASLDRDTILDLATALDNDNNLGCPLN